DDLVTGVQTCALPIYPSEPHGRIFSVTEKKFPAVVGDGRRTLEQLILRDERAVCAARLHCDRHRDKLSVVPADGEAFPLVELGRSEERRVGQGGRARG